MDRQAWRAVAPCMSLSPTQADELFFIGPGQKAKRAKLYCNSCPVKRECLNFAIVHDEVGIWGGTTDAERKALAFMRPILIEQARANRTLEIRDTEEWLPTFLFTANQEPQPQQDLTLPAFDLLEYEPEPDFPAEVIPLLPQQPSLLAPDPLIPMQQAAQ